MKVELADMLQARENRVRKQQEMLSRGGTLICLTMNIPGPVKTDPLIEYAFRVGLHELRRCFPSVAEESVNILFTGCEAMLRLNCNAEIVKSQCVMLEESHPLGRLWDIDVLNEHGEKLSREKPRQCLICSQPAFICARSRAHSVETMFNAIHEKIIRFRAVRIGEAACRALILELETTPKPGLVDLRNNGSHSDMNFDLLRKSAESLRSYYTDCAMCCDFDALQKRGVLAEKEMLRVTNGINTHKGAIFSLGLLCAAAAQVFRFDRDAICIKAGELCKTAIENTFSNLSSGNTNGERLYVHYGIRGIRGEAADGFPTLRKYELPANRSKGAILLLKYLSDIDDTTLIHRGGLEKARLIRARVRALLNKNPTKEEIIALDNDFIRENLTCGGCADLLACAYFLKLLEKEP